MSRVDLLHSQGYRVTSRAYRRAARIDREDWEKHCEVKGYPVNADWYRRCVTKDVIELTVQEAKELENSCHSDAGYKERKP